MPLYESHLTNYSSLRVGKRICEERQRLNLTLQDVAARSGISTARLSQIENDLYIPDVEQAHVIASALGQSLEFFLPSDRAFPFQLKRESELRTSAPAETGELPDGDCRELFPLADLFVGRQIEPILIRLLPGQPLVFRHHPGVEFAFISKGRVEFLVKTATGELREELQRGDCIYIRSRHPHSFRCLDAQPAECIHVLSAPSAGGLSGTGWVAPWTASRRAEENAAQQNGSLRTELSALRRARGYTTADVARIVGMKERQLEQLEKGERSAPLDVLLRLARLFGKPLRELLHDPRDEGPYYCVRRSTEIPRLPERPRRLPTDRPDAPMPNSYHPLFSDFPTLHMYPYLVRIRNIDMQMLVPHEHHGQEFFYVLDGQIELVTYAEDKRVSIMLGSGDSCYLDASVPHLLRGETRNPYSATSAELIDVYWCPLGEQYLFDNV